MILVVEFGKDRERKALKGWRERLLLWSSLVFQTHLGRRKIMFMVLAATLAFNICFFTLLHPWTIPNKDADWQYFHYSNSTGSRSLIAQYAGTGNEYMTLFQLSSRATHAYSRRHGLDVLEQRGIIFGSQPEHATYNKMGILREACSQGYEKILLLDADAVIVDHDLDILAQLPNDMLFLGDKVVSNHGSHTWNVNIGITVWNCRHPLFDQITKRWKMIASFWRFVRNSDQIVLQMILISKMRQRRHIVLARDDLFTGQAIAHFKRSDSHSWGDASKDRLELVREAVDQVCRQNPFCED